MAKEKFIKVMKAGYDNKTDMPIFKTEIDEGYKQFYYTGLEETKEQEIVLFISKTGDSKYKWQATEASTGLLACSGKTLADVDDEILRHLDRIYNAINGINTSERMIKILNMAKELVKNANLQ